MLGWLKGNGRWLALSALVLLNVVLITLLLVQQTTTVAAPPEVALPSANPSSSSVAPREPASSSAPASPRGSTRPSVSPSAGRSDSQSPSASGSATDAPRRLLAANSAKIAWRAEEGDCDHQSTVEVTSDGGRTWRKTKPGIRGIVRLKAYGENSVFAVGADANCRPTYAWINSPDGRWRRDQSVIWDVWFRYPSDLDRVHAPGGRTSRPCGGEIIAFAAIGSYQAAVLCADGRVRTLDRGRGWRTVLINSGGLTVNADTNRFLLARVGAECDGILLQTFDVRVAELSDHGACRNTRSGHREVGAASMGDVRWLWVGRDTEVS